MFVFTFNVKCGVYSLCLWASRPHRQFPRAATRWQSLYITNPAISGNNNSKRSNLLNLGGKLKIHRSQNKYWSDLDRCYTFIWFRFPVCNGDQANPIPSLSADGSVFVFNTKALHVTLLCLFAEALVQRKDTHEFKMIQHVFNVKHQ